MDGDAVIAKGYWGCDKNHPGREARVGPYSLDQCRLCWLELNPDGWKGAPTVEAPVRPLPAAPYPPDSCVRRGAQVGEETCEVCTGNVRIKTFSCPVHGRCHVARGKKVSAKDCYECHARGEGFTPPSPTPLLFRNWLSPGDVLVMTAAIEMLHEQHPGKYLTGVDTACDAIWENNPRITLRHDPRMAGARVYDPKDDKGRSDLYPLVHKSGHRPVHFLQGYVDKLAAELGIPLALTTNRPFLYLSAREKQWVGQVEELTGDGSPYWVINAGTKKDYTAKGYGRSRYQEVVDLLKGRVRFVQIGESGHLHEALGGVVDLRGKTDARQLIRLCYKAEGGLGPSTFVQHIFAALQKPYVCVAGGRENRNWLDYPTQTTLSAVGTMDCCLYGGCWKSRTVPLRDGGDKNESLCASPNTSGPEPVPECLMSFPPARVADEVLRFRRGGAAGAPVVRVRFTHGLGDCTYFAHSIPLYTRRGYKVVIYCNPNEAPLFEAAGAKTYPLENGASYPRVDWDHAKGGDRPFAVNKAAYNLNRHPMPNVGSPEELWDEYCAVRLDLSGLATESDRARVDGKVAGLPRPLFLVHTKGNSFAEAKNIPEATTRFLYKGLLVGPGTVIQLDWDNREPEGNDPRIVHVQRDWKMNLSLAELYYLITKADLLIGIDSGPGHFVRFTDTPAVIVWKDHSPVQYYLPRARTVHAVAKPQSFPAGALIGYDIKEVRGGEAIVDTARHLLKGE